MPFLFGEDVNAMLFRYIKNKIRERRRVKSMKKIIAELKKLLDEGGISQEDYDLAVSKLSSDEPIEETNNDNSSTDDIQSEENLSETETEKQTENTEDDSDEITDKTDPSPTEDNPTPPKEQEQTNNGGDSLQQVLEKLSAIETKIKQLRTNK